MDHFNTPAGAFRVFLNGKPMAFDAVPHCPYNYHDSEGSHLPILACYQVSINIQALSAGDVIEASYEHGTLTNDGGGEGMDNAIGCVGEHIIGIGVPDTSYLEYRRRLQLPFENAGMTHRGFLLRIIDDPAAYCIRQLKLIIAWESASKEYAQEIVAFMTS